MASSKVKVPKLGLTIETVTVTDWSKAVGERVEAGQVFGTIEADKASYEIEAPVAGTIAELVPAGDETEHPVGAVIAVITME
jgi:pyruvate/2-oxoglutarate dehydrogenase complex dihydrolipoamide acyltransferase (E2) component